MRVARILLIPTDNLQAARPRKLRHKAIKKPQKTKKPTAVGKLKRGG
jgi:hypothetical protein